MFIKSIKLQNIRSYLSQEINFPEGSLLLSGDVGSGKSTILYGIEFALFGVIRGSVDGISLLRHGKNAGHVELCFVLDNKNIVVHRGLRRNKKSIVQTDGFIIVDNLKTDYTPIELKARILDLLGYPKNLLTKSKALIYRYTVYTPQEYMKSILFEDSKARLDTLRKVFQIDNYKTIGSNAGILSSLLKVKIASLKAATLNLAAKKKQMAQYEKQISNSKNCMEKLLPSIYNYKERILKEQDLLVKYEADIRTLNKLRAELAAHNASLSEKNNMLLSSTNEAKAISQEIVKLNSFSQSSNGAPLDHAMNLAYLSHHIAKLSKQVEAKVGLVSEIDHLKKSQDISHSSIIKAQATALAAKKLERNVLDSKTCPVCLQPISESHKNNFRSKILGELQESDLTISEKIKEKIILDEKLAEASEKFEAILETERRLAKLQGTAEQYLKDVDIFGVTYARCEHSNYDIGEALNVLASSSKIMKERMLCTASIKEKEAYLSKLQNRIAQNNVKDLKMTISGCMEKLRKLESSESRVKLLKANIEQLRVNQNELEMKKAYYKQEIDHLNQNALTIMNEISLMDQAEKKLDHLIMLQNWIKLYFNNLMEVIERNIMLKVYNEFNSLFQTWFNILVEDESLQARLDESFTPIVEINGYENFLDNLSGGEKTSCALAYRLALNKVINDVISTIKTRDFLILDEPTDGFSSHQLEKIREVLYQLNLPQIIIVSHEPKIESFVSHVMPVVKEQQVSHVLN